MKALISIVIKSWSDWIVNPKWFSPLEAWVSNKRVNNNKELSIAEEYDFYYYVGALLLNNKNRHILAWLLLGQQCQNCAKLKNKTIFSSFWGLIIKVFHIEARKIISGEEKGRKMKILLIVAYIYTICIVWTVVLIIVVIFTTFRLPG